MPRKLSEERTRKEMIDPQLEQAGWYLRDHSKVKTEIPVEGLKTSEVSETSEVWENGVTDYTLYRENGEVLAVVEAKKTAVDVRLAEAQPKDLRSLQDFGGLEQTRTTMGLIDVFMRSNQARDVLLVDRNGL
jgi:type I site-specific restriction endonuclease